ncbi:hypothetical protein Tco_0175358 [Tanacetum coccineum]
MDRRGPPSTDVDRGRPRWNTMDVCERINPGKCRRNTKTKKINASPWTAVDHDGPSWTFVKELTLESVIATPEIKTMSDAKT